MRGIGAGVALAIVSILFGACGSGGSNTLLVMTAASLTDAFQEIESAFEQVNPDIDVQLNLAGSSALREQILEGAPADVFASADVETMAQVASSGAAQSWNHFATNELALAVPTGNPADVSSLRDLTNPDLLVGLCADGVPCGVFARQALDQVGIEAQVDTNEGDVRALVTKLEAGELDAGIVYASDIAASDQVEAIPLATVIDVPIVYPIALLDDGPNIRAAQAFIAFVLSDTGQTILQKFGFGQPADRDVSYSCNTTTAAPKAAACR